MTTWQIAISYTTLITLLLCLLFPLKDLCNLKAQYVNLGTALAFGLVPGICAIIVHGNYEWQVAVPIGLATTLLYVVMVKVAGYMRLDIPVVHFTVVYMAVVFLCASGGNPAAWVGTISVILLLMLQKLRIKTKAADLRSN